MIFLKILVWVVLIPILLPMVVFALALAASAVIWMIEVIEDVFLSMRKEK